MANAQENAHLEGMPSPKEGKVTRRKVFYIPGYDPIPPRRYRELYRKEGEAQAKISGYSFSMKGLSRNNGAFRWAALTEIEGHKTEAEIEFLEWSDLVGASMTLNIFQTYLLMARTFWLYLSSGALYRLIKLRPQPMIAALFPVVMLVLYLVGGISLGMILTWVISFFIELPALIDLAIIAAVLAWFLIYFKKKDNKIMAYYLMYDYGFTAQDGGRMPASLSNRVNEFCDRIEEALAGDFDEVLLVGHSSGAHLGVQVGARLLRKAVLNTPQQLSFLTLGEVVPMVSFLPTASDLRADLHLLSKAPEIYWVDITAPTDGGCFALCDPVRVTGVAAGEEEWVNPKVVSAAFTQTLKPERAKEIKWKFFRAHFQYLCAFDYPREYDYYMVTAGPLSLVQRFDWRGATASRKEIPLSPYTDMG